mgnify:CR=1 FL=1
MNTDEHQNPKNRSVTGKRRLTDVDETAEERRSVLV